MHAERVRRLDRFAGLAVLGIAPGMLHAYVVAEVLIALIGLGWLVRCALLGEWRWLREGWVPFGLAWWGWAIFCSLPGIGEGGMPSLVQGLVVGRYLLLLVALERQVLGDPAVRRAGCGRCCGGVRGVDRAFRRCAVGVRPQPGRVSALGRRGVDRPFQKPRAGAPLARLVPVVVVPVVGALLAAGTAYWRVVAAAGIAALGVAMVVLIGQRMPVLLTVLGLVVAAGLLPRLRVPVAAALLLGAGLVAASAVVAPPTFYRLVTKFSTQMSMLPYSNYGQIASRAVAIVEDHPLTGRGFDGFRSGCADTRYWRGWHHGTDPRDDGGAMLGCNIHPHNTYLQVATDAGLPGLALFVALVVAWGMALGRGLWASPAPVRVGLFATFVMAFWPVASNQSAFAIELGGLSFLLLGFGLAEARAAAGKEGRPGLCPGPAGA